MTADIENLLSEYIRTQILRKPKMELGKNDPLLSVGLIDSFHLVDLAVYIEDQFNVRIDDTELNAETFDTVHQLAEIIRARKK